MTPKMTNDAKKQSRHLPPGWQWVNLGEICKVDRRLANLQDPEIASLPFLGMENVESQTGRIISSTLSEDEGEGSFLYGPQHVLYGKLRPYLNKVVVTDTAGRCSMELVPLLPQRGFDRHLLALILRAPSTVSSAVKYSTGGRQPRAGMDKLLELLVPIPGSSENQRTLAAHLDAQMAKVQRMRQAAERQLEATRAMPGALLHRVFRYKEGDVLPTGWRWARLRDVVSSSIEQCNPANRFDDVFTYIDISSVDNVSKRIVSPQVLRVPEAPSRARQIVETNDVLVATTRPNLNAVALVPPELDGQICSTGFCVLRALREELARYIFAYVQSPPFVHAVSALVQGALYPAIKDDDVKDCWMSLPPPNEQRTIVARLESQMSVI